jgi:hypothetical protein
MSKGTSSLVRYRSVIADNARWEGFLFRDDDIIISAPIKSGITWLQMICALLIFQHRIFPKTLDLISPWLEMLTRPLAEVLTDLNAQQHRRFIKSHTPLDGLPFDDRVTYVCIGRDPRDAALSYFSHISNMDVNALLLARHMTVGLSDILESASERPYLCPQSVLERFSQWVEAPSSPGLRATVHHLATFWQARALPNVVLLHYDELQADLGGQMRKLAARLGVKVPESLWHQLVSAATFDNMRKRADEIVPNLTEGIWYENARFFNKGSSGQWQHLIDDTNLRRYQALMMEIADAGLNAWLHRD